MSQFLTQFGAFSFSRFPVNSPTPKSVGTKITKIKGRKAWDAINKEIDELLKNKVSSGSKK